MHYYIIVEGMPQIENIFFGETKEDVIEKARSMINQWWEFRNIDNDELIEMLESSDIFEFELVKINCNLPTENITKKELIELYHSSMK